MERVPHFLNDWKRWIVYEGKIERVQLKSENGKIALF